MVVDLAEDVLLGVVARVAVLGMYFGDFETFVLEGRDAGVLGLYEFDECDVFGEVGEVGGVDVGGHAVLGTGHLVLFVLLFGYHGVQADFAVGVAAGGQQPRQVVAPVLVPAHPAVQLRLHFQI